MDLETYQRSLHQLIVRGEPLENDPTYVQALAGSSRLAVVREIVCFWRAHGLERYCILTATWLKRMGRFESDIEKFVAEEQYSPFIEETGQQFLSYLSCDDDLVVAALAKFEIALHETRIDFCEERIIDWPCDPEPILSCILQENDILEPLIYSHYRVTVSRALPGGFICELIENN
jgi:hypothetical protein